MTGPRDLARVSTAERYQALAKTVADPELRRGYEAMARDALEAGSVSVGADGSVTVEMNTPALDDLAAKAVRLRGVRFALSDLAAAGRLGELESDVRRLHAAFSSARRPAAPRTWPGSPVDDLIVKSAEYRDVSRALGELAKDGRLGQLAEEIGRMRATISRTGSYGPVTAGPGGGAAGQLRHRARELDRIAGATPDRAMRDECAALAKSLRDRADAL